jgi:hypothetical protein
MSACINFRFSLHVHVQCKYTQHIGCKHVPEIRYDLYPIRDYSKFTLLTFQHSVSPTWRSPELLRCKWDGINMTLAVIISACRSLLTQKLLLVSNEHNILSELIANWLRSATSENNHTTFEHISKSRMHWIALILNQTRTITYLFTP